MKKLFILIFSLSICSASVNMQKKMQNIFKSLQDQHQIYSLEDLTKKHSHPLNVNRANSNRDMSDLVGEWYRDQTNISLHVTVDSNQSAINALSLMAFDTAEGVITATHNDFVAELNYLFDPSYMEGDDDEYYEDYYRDAGALTYAQNFVDEMSSQYGQSTFDLTSEFSLTIDGDIVTGGLGGANPDNCEINWPEDPYKMAVYSFVSEYVLEEGASVGCFVDSDTLDQTYENVALDMESGWSGNDDDDDDNYSYGPRIGAYLTDLDPSMGGQVYFDDTDTVAIITFVDVPLIDDSTALNTFQIQLIYATNEVVLSYKDLSLSGDNSSQAPGGLAIGIANGDGVWMDVDLSESLGEFYSNPVEGYDSSNELDMEYKKITFSPNDDYTEYSVMVDTITDLPGSYSNSITVEDDDYTLQSLSSGFNFYGETWNEIYVNNDGNIGFEDGDETCVCWICENGDGDCAAQYLAGGDSDNGGGGDEDYTVCGGMSSDDPDWVCCDCDCMDFNDMVCLADDDYCLDNIDCDGDDDQPDLMIMNFDILNMFMFMFGLPPEGVDNPLMVIVDFDQQMVAAQGLTVYGGTPSIYFANPSDFASYVLVDTIESTITFNELDLVDSNLDKVFTLNGTIGPSMTDLEAGVETVIPYPPIFNEDNEDLYVTFYDDSTGIEATINNDYNGGYEEQIDTSNFYWHATSDSLYMLFAEDYDYVYGEWRKLTYERIGDDAIISDEEHPCDSYYYTTMDECLEEISQELPMLVGIENVTEFYARMEQVFTPVFTTSIADDDILPEKFELYPVYPNPFNPVTTIRFDVGIKVSGKTTLKIYDISGKTVETLINDQYEAGTYEARWDASGMASGIYFSELISGDNRKTQKMILLK